jgi:signal transduction histidine kinase
MKTSVSDAIDNGLKESPMIKIQTEQIDQDYILIRIADNGPGMSEGIQKRLFDPFFTTKPVGKGTGMGMSISHQIITERHKGTLRCISAPGQGTEFMIQIPIRQSHWPSAA